jgi:hypothetical protein
LFFKSFVGVKATTSFYAEEVAKEIPPSIRQCHVEGEKKLKYFQRYSRSACSVECDTQFMEERCHCRPFYFKGTRLRSSERKFDMRDLE